MFKKKEKVVSPKVDTKELSEKEQLENLYQELNKRKITRISDLENLIANS